MEKSDRCRRPSLHDLFGIEEEHAFEPLYGAATAYILTGWGVNSPAIACLGGMLRLMHSHKQAACSITSHSSEGLRARPALLDKYR